METEILNKVFAVIEDRRDSPKQGSYVSSLLAKGESEVIRKFGEEADELGVAAKGDEKTKIIHEAADVVFHMMVLLAAKGVRLDDVMKELKRRRR
ncbi:MAG: phosphoribosyl-ATP diphosphatase [Candidatus Hadarchaeaceae archaeon]